MVIIFFNKPLIKNMFEILKKLDNGVFFIEDFKNTNDIKMITWLEYQKYIVQCEYNFYIVTAKGKQKIRKFENILNTGNIYRDDQ